MQAVIGIERLLSTLATIGTTPRENGHLAYSSRTAQALLFTLDM
jgi:hypothetical protein